MHGTKYYNEKRKSCELRKTSKNFFLTNFLSGEHGADGGGGGRQAGDFGQHAGLHRGRVGLSSLPSTTSGGGGRAVGGEGAGDVGRPLAAAVPGQRRHAAGVEVRRSFLFLVFLFSCFVASFFSFPFFFVSVLYLANDVMQLGLK